MAKGWRDGSSCSGSPFVWITQVCISDEVSLLGSVKCVINNTESASLKSQEYHHEIPIREEEGSRKKKKVWDGDGASYELLLRPS